MKKRLHISRRDFLKYSAASSTLVLSGCKFLKDDNPASTANNVIRSRPLPIPNLLTGKDINGKKVYDLVMQRGSVEFVPNKKTSTFGYNGNILGPTLQMLKGDEVAINVTNRLGEPSTTHWHGIHLPAAMDGGPHQRIEDGNTWQAHYPIINNAGTYWYHPHLMGHTGRQVYQGLAGLFIIKDPKSELALPDQYGIDDIPLIVQDKILNAEGLFNYPDVFTGVKGDHFLVNGAVNPNFAAPAQIVRFRILNGSNARFYNFGFSDNRQFYQICTDGGLLEKPVNLTRLRLTPGERAEILVDFSGQENSQVRLMSYSSELDYFNPMFLKNSLDETNFDIMDISVGSAAAKPITTVPVSLTTINRLQESQVNRHRSFVLEMKIFGKMKMKINGQNMDINRIDETVKLNDIEIWEIINDCDLPHPFHVHDIQFLILTINGSPPPENERGWKDTVLVKAHEKVRIISKFDVYSDPKLPYMYHCHILEHEDAGMMGQFIVKA